MVKCLQVDTADELACTLEIVYQPLTLYPSPLHKGRGREFLKGAKPLQESMFPPHL